MAVKNKKARDILQDPDLLDILVAEVQRNVTGEANTIKALLICTSGRLVENSRESSFNLIVQAASGTGKDYVVASTLRIFPDGIVEARKTISPKTFTYWHNALGDPTWTWDGRIFYGEDVPNRVLNDEVFKVMSSSGNRTSTIVVNNKAVDVRVNGKPVIIITTASADLSPENLRRFAICPLNETNGQTRRIKQKLSGEAKQGVSRTEPNECIKSAIDSLERVRVKIPFAQKLESLFENNLIIRTSFGRFLDLIKASAALHQYQREKTKDGTVTATWADYDIARGAMLKTNTSRTMIPLSGIDQAIWRLMKRTEPDMKDGWYSTHFITAKGTHEYKSVLAHLNKMVANGLLQKDSIRVGNFRPTFVWRPKKMTGLTLPRADEI